MERGNYSAHPQGWKTKGCTYFTVPISLLPSLSKVFEGCIRRQLRQHLEENIILIPEQFGFRPRHSCVHQAFRVVYIAQRAHNLSQHVLLTSLDIEKAFDKVHHLGLLHKLRQCRVPNSLLLLLSSFLHARTFRCKVGEHHSTRRPIQTGVPQGFKLGPILFSIYINDVPLPISPRVHLALFADDTALLAHSTNIAHAHNALQKYCTTVERHYASWGLRVNLIKSQAIQLTGRRRPGSLHSIILRGRSVPWTRTLTYLGIKFDRALKFGPHITRLKKKANLQIHRLDPILRNLPSHNHTLRVLLFTAYIRPILTYASPIWCCASKSNIRKLSIVQNKILRRISSQPQLTSNASIRNMLSVDLLESTINRLNARF